MDLETGWIDPWARNSNTSERSLEKSPSDEVADKVSLSPSFVRAEVDPRPDIFPVGHSTGDIFDISPWDEPPIPSGDNSQVHLIFPVKERAEDEEEGGTSTAFQRRISVDRQQTNMMRRWFREKKRTPTAPLPRPAVFEEELVVVDERVIEAHRDIVRDILVVGFVWALVWIALCLAIPTK
jgi:hypothetical protein